MARTRKSVAMIEQIRIMRDQGMGPRTIARCLKISKNTVKRILRSTPEAEKSVANLDGPEWSRGLDWEKIRFNFAKGVTLKSLHEEWASQIKYKQFWDEYRRRVPVSEVVTMRLIHKPGERTYFDFSDGIAILDLKTGEEIKTQLLCGVLPFSSFTYGEFVLDQKQSTFMVAIERAWHYFGGVTPYVTIDNLRAGVQRAHIYDPEVNKGFCDFANHWGFAVIPARPYKPRDKGANECGIGVIQRGFYNEVRGKTFFSLHELNQCFREYLDRLNREKMKDHGVSRLERFEVEKQNLKPLAATNYEPCEWKTAKVHADCHIQVENRFYSVPYQFVGQAVRVRLSQRLIEIFSQDHDSLASHARLSGSERVSTLESHYPEPKVSITRFEVKHAKTEADKIGPNTRALIDYLLNNEYPLKYLRRVQGILRLVQSERVSTQSLEYAAKQGMLFKKLTYEYIKSTANFFDTHGNRPVMAAPRRDTSDIYLHTPLPKEEEQ